MSDIEGGIDSDIPGLAPIFDPMNQTMEMSKDEKRRMGALVLAIKYHVDTIVQDAGMYKALVKSGAHLKPTHVMQVVEIAVAFDAFILDGGVVTVREVPEPDEHEASTESGTPAGEP